MARVVSLGGGLWFLRPASTMKYPYSITKTRGADSLPSYMHVATGSGPPPPEAQIARDNVTALDDGMQAVYAKSLEI